MIFLSEAVLDFHLLNVNYNNDNNNNNHLGN